MPKQKLTLKVQPSTKRRLRAVAKCLGFNSISTFLDHIADLLYASLLLDLKEKNVLTNEDLSLLPEEDLALMALRIKEFSKSRIERYGKGGSPPYSKKRVRNNELT